VIGRSLNSTENTGTIIGKSSKQAKYRTFVKISADEEDKENEEIVTLCGMGNLALCLCSDSFTNKN